MEREKGRETRTNQRETLKKIIAFENENKK